MIDLSELLEQWALDIDRDGTPSQAGPTADDLRHLAKSLRSPQPAGVRVKDLADAAKRMQEALDLHDAEVADELASEGERADLWTDIEVLVDDLRTILSALEPQQEEPVARPMAGAPKDGSMLRLICRFDGDSSTGAFEDADEGWTIGTNNLANTGEDLWEIVGWDWEQDTFRQAHTAQPIGWLPFHSNPTTQQPVAITDEMVLAVMERADELEEPMDADLARELLTAALVKP